MSSKRKEKKLAQSFEIQVSGTRFHFAPFFLQYVGNPLAFVLAFCISTNYQFFGEYLKCFSIGHLNTNKLFYPKMQTKVIDRCLFCIHLKAESSYLIVKAILIGINIINSTCACYIYKAGSRPKIYFPTTINTCKMHITTVWANKKYVCQFLVDQQKSLTILQSRQILILSFQLNL